MDGDLASPLQHPGNTGRVGYGPGFNVVFIRQHLLKYPIYPSDDIRQSTGN